MIFDDAGSFIQLIWLNTSSLADAAGMLRAEIERIVSAISAVGHSDALIATLQQKEGELRDLSAAKEAKQAVDPEEIRQFVGERDSGRPEAVEEVAPVGESQTTSTR